MGEEHYQILQNSVCVKDSVRPHYISLRRKPTQQRMNGTGLAGASDVAT